MEKRVVKSNKVITGILFSLVFSGAVYSINLKGKNAVKPVISSKAWQKPSHRITRRDISSDLSTREVDKKILSDNNSRIEQLNYYPDPGNGKINLYFETKGANKTVVTITDILGKSVFQQTVPGEGRHNLQIDISNQHSGIYLLNLQHGNQSISKRIILE